MMTRGLGRRFWCVSTVLAAWAGVAWADKPPVAIRSYEVRAEVTGLAAVTTVEVVYVNYTDGPMEAQLQWQLPADAAGTDMAMWVSGLRAAGALTPRVEARRIYQEIVQGRRDPALLEYAGGGQWSLRVFPIPAAGTQKVQVVFHQMLRSQEGWVRYEAPVVVSGTGVEAAESAETALTIRAPGGVRDVRADTRRTGVFRQGDGAVKAGWRDDQARLATPFAISYQAGAPLPQAVTFAGPDKASYFAAVIPGVSGAGAEPARNVVIVVDASASMKGKRMEMALAAAERVLDSLSEGDRFGVVAGEPNVCLWQRQLVKFTKANAVSALGFLRETEAAGGADLAGGLRAAASLAGKGSPVEVLLITDGEDMIGASGTPEPAATSRPAPSMPAGVRVHPLAIEQYSEAMNDLALRTGGSSWGVATNKEEAQRLAGEFLKNVRLPEIEGVKFTVKGQGQVSQVVGSYTQGRPDAVIAGRVARGGPAVLAVSGTLEGKPFAREVAVAIPEPGAGMDGWGGGALEAVAGHLKAEAMWEDLRANPKAKPEDLAALLAWSRARRVATRASAFLVLENDLDYLRRGIEHGTASVDVSGTLRGTLERTAREAPQPPADKGGEHSAKLLARGRELRRQKEYVQAAGMFEAASRAAGGIPEALAEAALLRDFAALREEARWEETTAAAMAAAYKGVSWDRTLLPPGVMDAVPVPLRNQPRRVPILPDIQPLESDADKAVIAKLQKPVRMAFEGQELKFVLDYLRETTGAAIHVKWRALEAAEIQDKTTVSVNLKAVPAEKALSAVLNELSGSDASKKIEYRVDDGVIVVSTASDLGHRVVTRSYNIPDLIEEDGPVPFIPRRAILPAPPREADIGLFGGPLEADSGADGPPGPSRTDLARLGEGVPVRLVVSAASGTGRGTMRGVGAAEAQTTLSNMVAPEDRPVAVQRTARQLLKTVKSLVAPPTWRTEGANWEQAVGTIEILNGRMVVTQTPENHALLVKLLNELRAEARARQRLGADDIGQARGFPEPLFTPDARLAPWVADLLARVREGRLSEFSSVETAKVGSRRLARVGGAWLDVTLTPTARIHLVVSASGAGAALYKADPELKACEKLGLCVVVAAGETGAVCFDECGIIDPEDATLKAIAGALNARKK